jgi:hypothetical protein
MNCDDAFELLTTGAHRADARLSVHLSECRRCRAMAETLSPALELFRSAKEPSPISSATEESSVALAQRTAARLAGLSGAWRGATLERPRRPSTRTALWRRWIVASVGAASLAIIAVRIRDASSSQPAVAVCPRNSSAASEWMSANSLPVSQACMACHPPVGRGDALKSSPLLPLHAGMVLLGR